MRWAFTPGVPNVLKPVIDSRALVVTVHSGVCATFTRTSERCQPRLATTGLRVAGRRCGQTEEMGSVSRRQRRQTSAAAAVWGSVLLGLVSCGTGHRDLSDAAARVLQHDVNGVTAAASAGDPKRVEAALQQLRVDVARQHQDGELSAARAARILAAGARIRLDISGPPTPSPRPTPGEVPRTPPATDRQHRHDGGDNGDSGDGG